MITETSMFDKNGEELVFKYGKKEYQKALEAAALCDFFELDKDEDELIVSTQDASCYNCLFRRWSAQSFTCMKKALI
ncbi:MAG: molybdopterin biosynthesis protein MoeB [Thiovulaceae bacterium]|nr:molybdopterin biosynthesis protein MoeB [Sulfurimonadaceae bacterium]